MMPRKVFFEVTSVSREDVRKALPKYRGKITDIQMDTIARKLGDDYVQQLFWNSLETIAETVLNEPQIMTEPEKTRLCLKLLRDKWSKGETVKYNGKVFHVGKEGHEGLNSFRLETEACHNLPETATYTLGKDAFLVAEDDIAVSNWEVSKQRLLKENVECIQA